MVNNSLGNATNSKELEVKYDSNGETVILKPSTVRKYLSTNPAVTDQEVIMFISLCKFQHLNPFLHEAYLIKYGSSPATIVTGKDVFLKRARKQKDFLGIQSGVIVHDSRTGDYVEREGTFVDNNEEILIGGWAKVHVKGMSVPFYASVSLDEYIGKKSDGTPNGQWSSKPATMIRKVALSQALREAYPLEMGGLYEAEEIGVEEPAAPTVQNLGVPIASDLNAPEPEKVSDPSPVEPDSTDVNNIEDALFNSGAFEV